MTIFKCTYCGHTANYPHMGAGRSPNCSACGKGKRMERHVTPPSVSYKCVEVTTAVYNSRRIGAFYAGGVVVDGTSDQERDKLLLILRVED